jgi:uncharacterized membrane protein
MATKDSKPKTKSKTKAKKTTIVKKKKTKTTVKPKKVETKTTTHKSDNMAKEDNKIMAVIAYLIGVLTIIIYLVKKEDSYLKFHALQSIVLNLAVFAVFFIISIVMMPLTVITGGICGILYFPLMVLPFVLYIYVFYKVWTTGDLDLPYLTEFVKKNLKKYY